MNVDIDQILKNVAAAQVFSGENYREYNSLSPTMQEVFAITHILRHLADLALKLGEHPPFRNRKGIGCKLLFHSIRFSQVTGLSESSLKVQLDPWTRQRFRGAGGSVSDCANVLMKWVLKCLAAFEPVEHGKEVPLHLYEHSEQFLKVANQVVWVWRIKPLDLEDWLHNYQELRNS